MDHDAPFEALNPLEEQLLQAQQGALAPSEFLDNLLQAQVFVLLDTPIGEDGQWHDGISPLVLTSQDGEPMFAVFTAVERASIWHAQLPEFEHALQVDVQWLLGGFADGVGIVVNPGVEVGMEMVPDAVAQLRQRAAAIARARQS